MTNMELIAAVRGDPHASERELILADRLSMALDEIDALALDIHHMEAARIRGSEDWQEHLKVV